MLVNCSECQKMLHVASDKSAQYPTSVVGMWQHLIESAAETYPLDDLVPTGRRLSWVLGGGPWTM